MLPECLAPYLGGELLIKAPERFRGRDRGRGRRRGRGGALPFEAAIAGIDAESRRLAEVVASSDLERRC